ncbi:MAG: Exopolysaccharide biosynthesis polyprenyl glycosylphosphotransferase [Parcubacteria group bacterium GW2011_GWC2_39_14]|nr:MAG: Exopolysaccharide biosynthesis polyprenyl glycosylphosphotransferase [Parcubacteria group bacterium GW2011_GWC2_39_14]KKR53506.1 MAG: Exopolysaccharide biosynthesis polyprenyl glycosylphosphotransferase [Parcubacteria group bacterium GW2011_GWA2_40_23]
MKKKAELFFTFLKIPLDYLILVLAALAAWSLRFNESVQAIRPVIFNLSFSRYVTYVLAAALIWLIFFAWSGLYSFTRRRIIDELTKVILACSTGMTAIIIYMFFVRELFDSRFIVILAWSFAMVFVIIERAIIRKFQNMSLSRGLGAHKIVIVGTNENTEAIIETFRTQPELGYKIVAHIKDYNGHEELLALHKKYQIDEIIQTDSNVSRKNSIALIDFANEHNIIFKYAAGQFEARTTNVEVHMIAGIPIIEIRKTKLDGWHKIIKRVLDLLISSILIIILSPFMFILAILLRLEDWGPAIYKNERVHSKGTFNVFKFRSMYTKYCTGKQFAKYTDQAAVLKYEEDLIKKQSERQGPVYKILNDPRRTPIGRFIERASIDELPQLFNVWIGNMSLVGPRPHQPREVEKYDKEHKHVLDIKPGMTGLAQISGRSDLDFEKEVKLDTYYIENWSFRLDFWILLKTPLVVLSRKSKV